MTIGKLFAEYDTYVGNETFRYLSDKGISPCIKIRNNVKIRWKKGDILRNLLMFLHVYFFIKIFIDIHI
ncbi:MAG TPA: hypothetical protein VN704_00305 [Verrucomicrobiae bacterium]|nr:hypothetical protein [Verrucomicrobiae bacterium]